MRTKLTSLLGLIVLATVLCGFRPFAQVNNVCPRCPDKEKVDVVVLASGDKVRCDVVAQNDDYYVLERYGEYRAVPKSEVSSVEGPSRGAGRASNEDQVILGDGVVLHGRIQREARGMYFIVQMGKWQHVAWVSQIKAVYKAGKPYAFR